MPDAVGYYRKNGVCMKPDNPGYKERFGKMIPVMIDLLIDVRRCQYAGFLPGHPIRDALRELIQEEAPRLKYRIARAKAERERLNRKPIQMRLW
jgi:hypothetical protein